ncbi:LPXTG cell wall anchor domain-containing protein, partial [Clostridium sp.]|uniref:LPXTG cell wall anchor domain-containing protein n=1 Tax=Clostridium sp. TaxID=1506 RepID=UPI0039A034A6
PEVKPEKPEVKPEEPEVKPEKPEVKPEVKPEKPEINPELPGQEEKVENSNLINKLPKTGKMPTIILGLLITIGGAFIYKKKK